MINSRFIKDWIPDDQDNPEENKYKDVLETIQEQDLRIDKKTFQDLYDWKAARSSYSDIVNYILGHGDLAFNFQDEKGLRGLKAW